MCDPRKNVPTADELRDLIASGRTVPVTEWQHFTEEEIRSLADWTPTKPKPKEGNE